jgi:hypothetical protein
MILGSVDDVGLVTVAAVVGVVPVDTVGVEDPGAEATLGGGEASVVLVWVTGPLPADRPPPRATGAGGTLDDTGGVVAGGVVVVVPPVSTLVARTAPGGNGGWPSEPPPVVDPKTQASTLPGTGR